MVRLVTQKDLEKRLALGPVPLAKDSFDSALVAASLRMEAELDTQFDAGASTDVFYLDESLHGVVPNGYFRLKLKNGFLRGAPTISIGDTEADAVAVSDCKVDLLRGHVHVPEAYEGQMVVVTYEFGFQDGDAIPEKLKEAVLAYIPAVFDFSAVSGDKKKTNEAVPAMVSHALAVATPLRRKIPFLILPVY